MTEADLKRHLVKTIVSTLPNAVVLNHTGAMHAGIPDLSVTWNGHTTWWEVKHAHPTIASRGVQDLMMTRLSKTGTAFYVIYQSVRRVRRTGIVHPQNYKAVGTDIDGTWVDGFNHVFVAEFIREFHLGH